MYGLYGLLLCLAWAVVLPCQIVSAALGTAPLRLRERLGFVPAAGGSCGGIWIHAVSVGEVRLARALLARLRSSRTAVAAHLTTTTATGRDLAAGPPGDEAGRPDSLSQFPFDFTATVGRLLDRLRPRAVLIMETEIWPNLLRACGARGLPTALVNGRISPRSFRLYRAARPLLRRCLTHVSLFAMQSDEDAARIRSLGADPSRIHVTGSLKYDLPAPSRGREESRRALGLPPDIPLLVAGSTAPGEEMPVARAFAAVRRHHAAARLIVAPRHPGRFAEAARVLRRAGLRVALHSAPTPDWEALLVDRLGVLPSFYAACDVAFVGGSLVRRGGQNMLEPAALGVPSLYGPRTANFAAAASALAEAGGGFVVRDGRELGETAVRLLSDPQRHAAASAAARKVVAANRGAMDRTVALLAPLLAAPPATGHAPPPAAGARPRREGREAAGTPA